MTSKKKLVVALISGILLILLYIAIFSFSGQNGDTSGSLSMRVTRLGIDIWEGLTGEEFSQSVREELASFFEHPLRKAAHFMEYAVMGILIYSLLYYYVKSNLRRYIYSVLWVFLSATLDEIHQYFVPGRWASAADVLLDTCGGATGALLCFGIICLAASRKIKKIDE